MHRTSVIRTFESAKDCSNISRADSSSAAQPTAGEQSQDFGRLLAEAFEEALTALGHRSPEQYLHLAAVRKREALRAPVRASWCSRPSPASPRASGQGVRGTHASAALLGCRNEMVVHELSFHLAFEIVNAAQRYATFLASFGEYSRRSDATARSLPPGAA